MIEKVKNSIRDAQMILVGIGEEFDAKRLLKNNEDYCRLSNTVHEEWVLSYVQKAMLSKVEKEYKEAYQKLANCLKNKNYFVISLCQDHFINESGLDMERVVEPCGTYEKLQCSDSCHNDLYDVPADFMEQISLFIKGELGEEDLKPPVCPVCGKPLVFNLVEAENYIEEGYLPKWQKYKLWLQGTVNRKLCVLELGVGMRFPSVIRWPFEKIVFFNQKAELFRVHSKLYQITEEIKEKGYGICLKPIEFIKELSNEL